MNQVAKRYHADRFIKLLHKVEDCRWDERQGKWCLTIRDLTTNEIFTDSSDVLISARGGLNNIAWPQIPGLDTFAGKLMHSASWDTSLDCSNKRIGIIGNGSSGIQILPKLQKLPGAHIVSFARSPTWISPSFGQQTFERVGMKETIIPEQAKENFARDPAHYQKFRVEVEEDQNKVHHATLIGTRMQINGQKAFEENMRTKLAPRPEILDALMPQFPPGCRRLTPGPGYLEALTQENVEFVNTDIAAIESSGVRTVDDKFHELDVLVCATGFHTDFKPPFNVWGMGGKSLKEHWTACPRNYLSLATDLFPNMFFMLGPNAAIGAGSLTMMIEATGDYIIRCARKLQKENIKWMMASGKRVDNFVEYAEEYFKRTVYSTHCKSWYKTNGKVSGLWPGSTLHCLEALRSPRWEDFEYSYGDDENLEECNRLAFLGNGWSKNGLEGQHMAWYLYPEFLEVPDSFPEQSTKNNMRMFSH